MKLFSDGPMSDYTRDRLELVKREVNGTGDDYLLKVNETEYSEFLIGKYSIDAIVLDEDGIYVTEEERDIPAEMHPQAFFSTSADRSQGRFSRSICLTRGAQPPHDPAGTSVTFYSGATRKREM